MIERPDADALLAGELGTWLAAQNDARAAARARARNRLVWGIGAGVFFGTLALLMEWGIEVAFWAGSGIIAAGYGWAEAAKRPVVKAIKSEINRHIAQALALEYQCDFTPGEELWRAKSFQLLPGYDRSEFEDRWSGTLGAMPFELYEAHLQEWQQSGKNRRLVTVFRGTLMTVHFARRFHGTTLVERAGRRMTFFGLRDTITFDDLKLEKIDMVDPRFADDFAVWSNDQVEARYLVHPEYVERLMAVEQAFDGKKLRALFQGGELLIVLETGNLFESGSLEADEDRERLVKCIDQFTSLADLAVQLNERPRGNFSSAAP